MYKVIDRSGANGRVLKQHVVRGYYQVWLSRKNKVTKLSAHRAVLMAFYRLPKDSEVCNHKDGNKFNNNIENLEWCSREYNEAHKKGVLGQDGKGQKNSHYGYRKAKLYPSEYLRNKLCSLGVPRHRHNLAELGEMLPKSLTYHNGFEGVGEEKIFHAWPHGESEWQCGYYPAIGDGAYNGFIATADTEANARASMLVYLIEKGIVKC